MNHYYLLADATSSGGGLVKSALALLLVGICALLVWAFGRWVITKFAAPPIAMTVWSGLFLLIGLIVIINFLMGLAGHPFIPYW